MCERTGDWAQVPRFQYGKFVGMREAPKYHAQIKDEPGFWAAGMSRDEAIGDLIRCHPERFNVVIIQLGREPR